jgi:hypothetical protein
MLLVNFRTTNATPAFGTPLTPSVNLPSSLLKLSASPNTFTLSLDSASALAKSRLSTLAANSRNALSNATNATLPRQTGRLLHNPPLSFIGIRNGFNLYKDADGNDIEVPPECYTETHTILSILRQQAANPPPSWSPEVDFDDFISAFLHWKEATLTSPSHRHLGLYKALVTVYINASEEFCDSKKPKKPDPLHPSTQAKAEQILRLIHGLASLATQHGFFFRRWVNVINVVIYKKPGCIELDRLRVIHLFEADFNLLIGVLFGRRAMHHAISNDCLHHGQYGKPGGECQDAALSKVLHNLLSFFTKTPLSQFESDATACFDRVVMAFALLCFSVKGAPPRPTDDVGTVSLQHHSQSQDCSWRDFRFLPIYVRLPHYWSRPRFPWWPCSMLDSDIPPS